MNDFAIDDGELNGQPEVWLTTESPAPLSLSLSGGVNKARFIQSVAATNVASSFNANLRIGLKSATGYRISLSALLPPSVRKRLSSSAVTRVQSSGMVLRRAKLGGLSGFVVDSSGGVLRRAMLGGLSDLDVDMTGAMLCQTRLGGMSCFDIDTAGGVLRQAKIGGASGFVVDASGSMLRKAMLVGMSDLEVDMTGSMLRKAMLGGMSDFDVVLSGAILRQAKIGGLSDLDLDLSGDALRQAMLGGLSGLGLGMSGDVLRHAMLGGMSDFGVNMSGAIKLFVAPRGLFQLQVSAQAQAGVSHSRQLDGKQARVYLSGQSFERATKATMLESLAQQWLHSLGGLRRDSYSSAGTAIIQISGAGELRDGAKIYLEGEASVFVEVYSRGILGGVRYRYLESDAAMQIISSWNPVGHPVSPDVYIKAQQERVLFVDRDDRVIVVPTEVS